MPDPTPDPTDTRAALRELADRSTCRNCGRPIHFHNGIIHGWHHSVGKDYCDRQRPGLSAEPVDFDRAAVLEAIGAEKVGVVKSTYQEGGFQWLGVDRRLVALAAIRRVAYIIPAVPASPGPDTERGA